MKARICRNALQKSGRSDEVVSMTRNKDPSRGSEGSEDGMIGMNTVGTAEDGVACVEGIQITSSDVNCLNGVVANPAGLNGVKNGSSPGGLGDLRLVGEFKRGRDGKVRPVERYSEIEASVASVLNADLSGDDLTCIKNSKILHVAARDAFKISEWEGIQGPRRDGSGCTEKLSLIDWDLSDIQVVCGISSDAGADATDAAVGSGMDFGLESGADLSLKSDNNARIKEAVSNARDVCATKIPQVQERNRDSRKEPRTVKDTSGQDRGLKRVLKRFLNL